jgi:WD40 repeat protein
MLGGRYGWVPPGKKHSITADEVHYGALDRTPEDRGFAFFYFREEASTAAMVEAAPSEFRERQGSESQNKLTELKRAIVAAGLDPFIYQARWDSESRRLTGLNRFGDRVYDDLLASMKSDSELRDRFATDTVAELDEFADEESAMEVFIEERSERFVLGSRSAVLKELLTHASATGGNGFVCLTGGPGSGKSAMLAHLSQHSTLSAGPSILLISHFVGASPGSTDVQRTLRRLCHELKAGCPDITVDIPDDPERLRDSFQSFLRQACAKKHVVILLDAVNQLDSTSRSAGQHWLPAELPANARLVLSALEGPALDELRRGPHKPGEIELPPLTAADCDAIIDEFCNRYHKTLELDQRAALLAKTDASTPLFLQCALEELRTLGTYEEITQRITELPSTAQELFAWILERLENDDGFRDASGQRVGRELVSHFAALLGTSRYGLSQRELTDLLDAGDRQGNIAALLHLLRPYLMRRGELLDFYHSQFHAAAKKAWLKTGVQRLIAHEQLAEYFHGQENFLESLEDQRARARRLPPTPRPANHRKVEELVYQRLNVLNVTPATTPEFDKACQELEELLTDLVFLEAKCEAGMVFELATDFSAALRAMPVERPGHHVLSLTVEALRREVHFLSGRPEFLAQQLYNRLQWKHSDSLRPLIQAFEDKLNSTRPWVHPLTPYRETEYLVATLVSDTEEKTCCAISPDGALLAFGSGDPIDGANALRIWKMGSWVEQNVLRGHRGMIAACAVSQDRTFVVSAGWDEVLRVWDTFSGLETLTLSGHTEAVWDCAISSDGRLIVSAGQDATVRVWDRLTGWELARLEGHRGPVMACNITPDSKKIISVGRDGTLRVWDAILHRFIDLVHCGQGAVTCCAISPDGKTVVTGGVDHMLRIWDIRDRRAVGTLVGHSKPVTACDINHDGAWLVSASDDKTVRLWDLAAARARAVFLGHGSEVTDCRISNDGAVVVSSSRDGTVKTWDAVRARQRASVEEISRLLGAGDHEGPVTDVEFGPGGTWGVSASDDGSLRHWVTARGSSRLVLRGHTKAVHSCAISPDGSFIASASADNTVKLWDARSGMPILTLKGHTEPPMACAISPDGSKVLSGGWDGTLRIWDASTGLLQSSLRDPHGVVMHCSFSPDGGVVLAEDLGRIEIWDIQKGASGTFCRFTRDAGQNCAPAISPDGTSFISASHPLSKHSPSLTVWDITTGRELAVLTGHTSEVTYCGFSPDGRLAVSASKGDRTVRTWDLTTYKPAAVFTGHRSHPWIVCAVGDALISRMGLTCAISSAARVLVSAGTDGTLRVWELDSGQEIGMISLPGSLLCLALHPSRPVAICGDSSGGVYIVEIMGINGGPAIK